jgi:hypothetical protein
VGVDEGLEGREGHPAYNARAGVDVRCAGGSPSGRARLEDRRRVPRV